MRDFFLFTSVKCTKYETVQVYTDFMFYTFLASLHVPAIYIYHSTDFKSKLLLKLILIFEGRGKLHLDFHCAKVKTCTVCIY